MSEKTKVNLLFLLFVGVFLGLYHFGGTGLVVIVVCLYGLFIMGLTFYGLACGGGFPETPDQWIEKVLMFEEDVFKDIYGTDEYRIAYDKWREQLEANY